MKHRVFALIVCMVMLVLMLGACSSPSPTSQPPTPAPTPGGTAAQENTISQVKTGAIVI